MSGLDKIISEIKDEASAEAQQALANASAQAEAILAEAQAAANAKAARIQAVADATAMEIERSRDSAIALQRRQHTLATKQEVLAQTLEKALEALYALPDDEYFAMLLRLATGNAQVGQGQMLLCEKDKQRMPKNFEQSLKTALPGGALLSIAEETRPVDGGFVLKYGEVEENCSFAAMFNARADEFQDLVRSLLFG